LSPIFYYSLLQACQQLLLNFFWDYIDNDSLGGKKKKKKKNHSKHFTLYAIVRLLIFWVENFTIFRIYKNRYSIANSLLWMENFAKFGEKRF
jgi:hypothetical protein